MVIGIITLGMNLAQAKTQVAEQTTLPQEKCKKWWICKEKSLRI